MNGEAGEHLLVGADGNDELTGGPGPDTFQCGPGTDELTDFNASEGDKKTNDCEQL
jgi:Ca2+-binding RTX toxin-like protein